MRVDRTTVAPLFDNQIDALPQRNFDRDIGGDVIQQLHPECGQGFVIEIGDTVVRGKGANFVAHAGEGFVRSEVVEIAQRHRDVSDVSKFRRRNGGGFKCADQLRDFLVVTEIARFQIKLPTGCSQHPLQIPAEILTP